jgi:hypothetical protein
MKGYKAFNKGLICKGKQYKENETFEEERAVPCHRGMHFCKNPFDVLNFYHLVDDKGEFSDFAEVEAPDDAEVKTDDDIKYCTTKLKVGAKFSFAGFVKTCVDFVIEKTQTEKPDSGNSAQIGSSGDSAQIGSSGNSAKIGSSGDSAQIGSSGYSAKIGSSGDSAQIGSSGDSAQIGSSGNSAKIGSSGDSAQIGSSGYYAQIGSSGNSAKIGSSGDSAKIGSSGYSAKIKSTGYDSIICCAGDDSCVSAKKGSWITLAEWKYSYEKDRYVPKCVKTEYVDGERIKEDTMYKLIDGEFTEV